jgi:hypothetical protein
VEVLRIDFFAGLFSVAFAVVLPNPVSELCESECFVLLFLCEMSGLFGWWGKWSKFTPDLPLRCQTCGANVVGQANVLPPNSIYP